MCLHISFFYKCYRILSKSEPCCYLKMFYILFLSNFSCVSCRSWKINYLSYDLQNFCLFVNNSCVWSISWSHSLIPHIFFLNYYYLHLRWFIMMLAYSSTVLVVSFCFIFHLFLMYLSFFYAQNLHYIYVDQSHWGNTLPNWI
jgi:hypothetical protein